ncbi:MAG: zf-HC2 domain-containing protein [Acidobacteria bacterium]|nr:zf-HC2 domain-containing protein [Acidobacteriota bacterium]
MFRSLACIWRRRQLSAWADDALDERGARKMEHHLRLCTGCHEKLEALRALREEVRAITVPPPPAAESVWERIEAMLDGGAEAEQMAGVLPGNRGREGAAVTAWLRRSGRRWRWSAVAATVVVGLVLVWSYALRGPMMHHHLMSGEATDTPMVLDVGRYVREVGGGGLPVGFWRTYQAQSQRPGQPVEGLLFEPVLPHVLPGGYQLSEVKVLQEACCKALQLRYEADGSWVEVFQHPGAHPVDFGEATLEHRDVHGVACVVAQWPEAGLVARSFVVDGVNLVLLGALTAVDADALVAALVGNGG